MLIPPMQFLRRTSHQSQRTGKLRCSNSQVATACGSRSDLLPFHPVVSSPQVYTIRYKGVVLRFVGDGLRELHLGEEP